MIFRLVDLELDSAKIPMLPLGGTKSFPLCRDGARSALGGSAPLLTGDVTEKTISRSIESHELGSAVGG